MRNGRICNASMKRRFSAILSLGSAVVIVLALSASSADATEQSESDDVKLPNGQVIGEVDFERHVARVLSRTGCNAADCHGSFQGRGGMRLSLFGYSAKMDHAALAGDPSNGRVVTDDPYSSLILLKPSGADEHEGGIRFEEDSWEYEVLQKWIEHGAKWDEGSGSVSELVVEQGDQLFQQVGEQVSLSVIAKFSDGSESDVTMLSVFRSNNEAIADVDENGVIKANRVGDTSIVVEYCGAYVTVSLVVPRDVRDNPTEIVSSTDASIDAFVERKLAKLAIEPSSICDDETFLRRVMLDTIGTLPTAEDVLLFVNDPNPNKREAKIDALLRHPRHATLWATKLCDITGCRLDWMEGPEELRLKRAQMWHDWFRVRIEENVPYDEIALGVICATSKQDEPLEQWIDLEIELIKSAEEGFESNYADRGSLDLFWRRQSENGVVELEDMAELVGTAFLGVRINCARCHKHPFDQWTQEDYLAFGNLFSRVRFDASTELRSAVMDRLDAQREAKRRGEETTPIPRLQEVHISGPWRKLVDPETGYAPAPRVPKGDEQAWEGDPRLAFFEWLSAPDNPYFAPNFVNRAWAHYMGRGLVEPVDAFSVTNPPSHPDLMKLLADSFIDSSYDIRALEKQILMSDAYQRASQPNETNVDDNRNYSRALIRPLMAEVLVDALHDAMGTPRDFGVDGLAENRAIGLGADQVGGTDGELLRVLGRQPRVELCDCNREEDPSLRGTILMMSDEGLMKQIAEGGARHLWKPKRTDAENVRHLFLSTLSRLPDERELQFSIQHLETAGDRETAVADLIWGLLNSREFGTRH